MIVHKNDQAHTELEQVDTKQEDILILRGTLNPFAPGSAIWRSSV